MKLSEAILAGSLLAQGCTPVSTSASSGIGACDEARQRIQADNLLAPAETQADCDTIRLRQATIAQGVEACAGSPSHHLAMMHLDRRLKQDRPDCFQNSP